MRMAKVLHGFNAVAELKSALRPLVRGPFVVLHGFNAVAELKYFTFRSTSTAATTFSTASTPWPN